MKKNLKVFLIAFLIVCSLFIFTSKCYADVIIDLAVPETLESKYGLDNTGHGNYSRDASGSYWDVGVFIKNTIISIIMIIGIILVLAKIMKTKENKTAKFVHKIISIIIIVSYIVFAIIMFNKMLEKNESYVEYYGVRLCGYDQYYNGNNACTYEMLEKVLTTNSAPKKPSTAKDYLKYEEVNVYIKIKTKEYSFENTYSPQTVISTLLELMDTNLSKTKKYYLRVYNSYRGYTYKIIISDRMI